MKEYVEMDRRIMMEASLGRICSEISIAPHSGPLGRTSKEIAWTAWCVNLVFGCRMGVT